MAVRGHFGFWPAISWTAQFFPLIPRPGVKMRLLSRLARSDTIPWATDRPNLAACWKAGRPDVCINLGQNVRSTRRANCGEHAG